MAERGADALALAEQAIDKACCRVEASPLAGLGRVGARRDGAMHGDERVPVEDPHQLRVPLHADALAEERERDGIERAGDFDVAIRVDGALAGAEERKAIARERAAAPAARPRQSASRPGAGSCRECAAARPSDSSAAETHSARRDCRSGGP